MNCDTSAPASSLDKPKSLPVCPYCGREIANDALVREHAACLFSIALEAPQTPKQLGGYELLERLGEGGMGIVFKARHIQHQHTVALKMIRSGELATDEEVFRFNDEVKAAIKLEHDHVVPVYFVGEDEGHHFFTMKLMKGGSLADRLEPYRDAPRRAAEFVSTIAMAVHHAHQRGILHRDLKPGNILLDEDGKPHVADFGLAQHFDRPGGVDGQPNRLEGTPPYMASEQAQGKPLEVTADVYSLGVILFELLTGQLPFTGEDTLEILEQVKHRPAPDPRLLNPQIDLDLATICLRCLEKEPAKRYASAEALALVLQKYLRREPIGKVGPFKRLWYWGKREPLLAALLVEAILLVVVGAVAAHSGAGAQEEDRRQEVLRANEYAARWVAGTVLFKLNTYHDVLAKAARDFPPELYATLRKNEIHQGDAVERYCVNLVQRHRISRGRVAFGSFFILGMEGHARARWPPPERTIDYSAGDYLWRDYFKGAKRLADTRIHAAYISRTILSEASQTQRFAISAPIYDDRDEPIGIIVAMTDTGATLGTLELKDPSDSGHIAMVIAPRDNDRATKNDPLPDHHVILVHDSLPNGTTAMLKRNPTVAKTIALADASNPNRGLSQLLLTDPNAATFDEHFCDPVMDGPCEDAFGQTRPGRWLAGFAPIGNTGFVAIVETPRDAAAAPNQTLARRLLLWGVLPFFLGTALVAAGMSYARRSYGHSKNRKSWPSERDTG